MGAWIAANADNPLRDWVDDEEAFGEQTCRIFAKAYRAATKASAAPAARPVLTDFVKALNKLDGKYAHIDTMRGEQAYEAYHQLAKLMTVDIDQAAEWWGALSDF